MEEAARSEPNDPNAMALATAGTDGFPDVRMVLLKGFDESGFVFFTNLDSAKASRIDASVRRLRSPSTGNRCAGRCAFADS